MVFLALFAFCYQARKFDLKALGNARYRAKARFALAALKIAEKSSVNFGLGS
jgi:hypothetical protein